MGQLFYRSMACLVFIVATLTLLLTTRSAQANGPWYVRTDGADSHDCRTPATPCASVNSVLDKPDFEPGDTILMATGTYTATGEPPLLLDSDAVVVGGWDDTFITQEGDGTFVRGHFHPGILVTQGVSATARYVLAASHALEPIFPTREEGIRNEGTLFLDHVIVRHSGSTGIRNYGTLTTTNSVIQGNSSGISNSGTLLMIKSTIAFNGPWRFGSSCAGIANRGTVTLVDSAIYRNHTDTYRAEGGPGGGMCNSGRATLINSTVSFNAAPYATGADELGLGGGGIHNSTDEYLVLVNSTVSHNVGVLGGGIYNKAGSVFLYNSIVADNEISPDTRYPTESADCAGVIISRGYNLLGDSADCDWQAGTGDLLNVEAGLFSTLLGLPAFNPLLPFSPAVNAGDPAGCTGPQEEPLPTDQRGVPRVGRCDIGAYEYDPEHDPLFYSILPLLHRE